MQTFEDHWALVRHGNPAIADDVFAEHLARTAWDAARATANDRIMELDSECERERLRLAACGAAALGYFDGCKDEYKSASLDDVLRLRGLYSAERDASNKLENVLRELFDVCMRNGSIGHQALGLELVGKCEAAFSEVVAIRANLVKS